MIPPIPFAPPNFRSLQELVEPAIPIFRNYHALNGRGGSEEGVESVVLSGRTSYELQL